MTFNHYLIAISKKNQYASYFNMLKKKKNHYTIRAYKAPNTREIDYARFSIYYANFSIL